MHLAFNLNKNQSFFFMGILIMILAIGITVAQSPPDPGHGAEMIGPGTFGPGDYAFPENIDVQGDLIVGMVDGNLGVGTPPSEKLDVDGSISVTGGNDVCIEGGNCLADVGDTGCPDGYEWMFIGEEAICSNLADFAAIECRVADWADWYTIAYARKVDGVLEVRVRGYGIYMGTCDSGWKSQTSVQCTTGDGNYGYGYHTATWDPATSSVTGTASGPDAWMKNGECTATV